jgi:sodium/proline symporter
MITGGAMVFIWKFIVRPMGGVLDIYELLPAFILASAAIVLISLITPPPAKAVTDDFDKVVSMR